MKQLTKRRERKREWTLFCPLPSKHLRLSVLQGARVGAARPWRGSRLLPGPRASHPAQTFAVKAG